MSNNCYACLKTIANHSLVKKQKLCILLKSIRIVVHLNKCTSYKYFTSTNYNQYYDTKLKRTRQWLDFHKGSGISNLARTYQIGNEICS